jgi:hypothetical protein
VVQRQAYARRVSSVGLSPVIARWCICGALIGGVLGSPGSGIAAVPTDVYVCVKVAQVYRTPGHHPVGIVTRGDRFTVSRYSATKRWAYGLRHRPGHTKGWVRHSALCRTRPGAT